MYMCEYIYIHTHIPRCHKFHHAQHQPVPFHFHLYFIICFVHYSLYTHCIYCYNFIVLHI